MAILYFSGDQVAFFAGIHDTGSASEFTGVTAPFGASDTVEIEIPDQYIQPDGSFDPNEVQFTRVTVVRDGVRYDFDVESGSKVKETGGAEIKEAGDTFFTTNDEVGPPPSGPFAGLTPGKMVFSTDSTFSDGQTTTIDRTQDTDNNSDGDTSDSGEAADAQFNTGQASAPPCYGPGTRIDTVQGPRAVELLRPGDMVLTRDHGPQPVLWCRRAAQALEGTDRQSRPVLIKAGALGPDRPSRDLIVSPQHRVLVGAAQQLTLAFEKEAFAPAKALTGWPGIRHMMGHQHVTWVHFACARHEVIRANGCWSETLLLGQMAQRSLTPLERAQLRRALPPAQDRRFLNGPPARPCLTVAAARDAMRAARKSHPAHPPHPGAEVHAPPLARQAAAGASARA